MDWLVYVFGSGIAFFLGMLLVIAGIASMPLARNWWLPAVATMLTSSDWP